MDPVDKAQELEIQQREDAIRRQRETLASKYGDDDPLEDEDGNRLCTECCQIINPKRVEKAPEVETCVDCQQMLEAQAKHWGF